MSEPQIVLTESELEHAFRIFVNEAPRRMWLDYWRCSETTYKWGGARDPFDRFDPRHALARFLTEKFKKAGWSVSHPPTRAPFSGMEGVKDQ